MNKLNLNFYEILALMQTYDKRINEWNFNEFISEPLYILQSLLNNKKEEMSMDDKLICNILNILFFKKICKERGLKPIFYSIIRNPYRKRISKRLS